MSWGAVPGNSLFSGNELRSAVSSGIAYLKSGQDIPMDDNVLNRDDVEQYVHRTVYNTPAGNQCPCKNDVTFTTQFPCGSNSFSYNGL